MSTELTDAVIAGIMGWRGPGAYTAATLRKIREVIRAAVEADRAQHDKLLTIIAYAYQIAGAHDCPAHILDVLADPVAATNEQVETMLPYQPQDLADRAQQGEPHDDDIAWEHFASATKAKMAEGREKGRGGWEDPEQCPTERLQLMLLEHLKKGDPVDVANFCMMLWTRGEPVVAVDLKAARQAVLEDAAAICDNFAKRDMHPAECAGAIRMMKDSIK